MTQSREKTVLCLASYEKGMEYIRECKRRGWRVILLTRSSLGRAGWPHESLDEFYHMPDLSDVDELIRGVAYLCRSRGVHLVTALDDYDVEPAAALREHLRLPGPGASAARLFRDKLAMRVRAQERDVRVPPFVHVLNHDELREYTERVPPPWALKPRSEVSTMGIRRIGSAEELWEQVESLGDRASYYLLERYISGQVCHVDSLLAGGEVVFAEAHRYWRPPFDVYQGGDVFITRTLPRESREARKLKKLNRKVLRALGMERGAAHTEFIEGADGKLYFLETGARVGGAGIAETVEAATGVNLWAGWAALDVGGDSASGELPRPKELYAGVIVSLARQQSPDTSAYDDPEVVWRLQKDHHAGLAVASDDPARVEGLLREYSRRFREDYFASLPPLERPAS